MGSASWKTRLAALTLVTVVAATAVACSSTNSTTTTTASGGKASIGNRTVPSSAFSDHTGITATSIKVGNVSTLAIGGLFKGALVGTQAYADYVNSTGGVNGRKITVDSADDQYTGTGNKEATQNAVSTDAALVGGFSTFDSFGGTVLAQNPGVPDVTQVLDPATNALPNVYSAVPLEGGWEEGALQYYWKKFGSAPLQHVGTLVADLPSPEADWAGEKYVMEKVGYHVVYDADLRRHPVRLHPQRDRHEERRGEGAVHRPDGRGLRLGAAQEPRPAELPPPRGDGRGHLLDRAHPRRRRAGRRSTAPTSTRTPRSTSEGTRTRSRRCRPSSTGSMWPPPGSTPTCSPSTGGCRRQLFVQALKNAGSNPSRGSILTALSKVTSFNGGNIVTTSNPAARSTSNCYLVGQVLNSQWTRQDNPPINSPTNGYRCDYSYVAPPKS